jgi:hypothetical protein
MTSVEIPMKDDSDIKEPPSSKSCDSSSDEEDCEEEHISSEDLIIKLQNLIDNVKQNIYTDVTRQDISDSIEEYISGKSIKPIDPDTISYLFRGWWITDALKRAQNPGNENSEPALLDNCPFCLKKMDSKYDIDIDKEQQVDHIT